MCVWRSRTTCWNCSGAGCLQALSFLLSESPVDRRFFATAKSVSTKSPRGQAGCGKWVDFSTDHEIRPAGAEALNHSAWFIGTAKAVPFQNFPTLGFFRSL
jgi:hypothetical protein